MLPGELARQVVNFQRLLLGLNEITESQKVKTGSYAITIAADRLWPRAPFRVRDKETYNEPTLWLSYPFSRFLAVNNKRNEPRKSKAFGR